MNLGGIGNLMKNAGKIQEMMKQNQEELANTVVTGESGGGDVTVEMNAKYHTKSIVIADSILKEDKAVVEELVCAAVNDALRKVEGVTKEKMTGLGDMFGVDIPNDII
jgi:nucleoid-associated protein EbfC